MALQSVYGWQPFLSGSKLSTRKTETSWNLLSISIFLFIFSRHSSSAKWLEQSAPPGQQKHNAVVSPKMRRGQCLGDGGDRHLRENLRNRFVLKKAAGSTHIIFSFFWFVSSLESACRRRCRFSSFNTKTSFRFLVLIQVFRFAFLFNYVLFTNPDSISYFIFGCVGYGRQCCSHWPAARWHGGKWIFVWLLHYKTASCSCSPSRIPPYSAAKPYPSKGAILICRVPCEICQLETSQTLICMSPTGACNSTYGVNSSDLAD